VDLKKSGPIAVVHGVVRWSRRDLVQWICHEFRVAPSEAKLSRELQGGLPQALGSPAAS
jgi:hypothetical protein